MGLLLLAIVAALLLATIAFGVFHPRFALFVPIRRRCVLGPRCVALTFDDGPDPVWTPAVLDVLREEGVKAAFFVVGERLARHGAAARRAVTEGHILGNHTASHSRRTNFFREQRLADELRDCTRAVRQIAGYAPSFHRPPVGLKNPVLGRVVRELGLFVVTWDARGLDTGSRDAESIARRVVSSVRRSSIVLLHDGGSDRQETVKALPEIIRALREKGFTFARLDAYLGLPFDARSSHSPPPEG